MVCGLTYYLEVMDYPGLDELVLEYGVFTLRCVSLDLFDSFEDVEEKLPV